MSRALLAALLWGPAVLLAGACDGGGTAPSAPPPVASRRVRDTMGVEVALPPNVRRIVTTVPGLTETVAAFGLATDLVGVSDRDPVEGALGSLPRIPVFPRIPAEAVAALRPDLLLVDRVLSAGDLPALRARFPMTFATDSRSLDGVRETFLRLGEALGHDRRADLLARDLDRARRDARVEGRPSVLVLAQDDPPIALGPGALLDDMVRAVGAENVAFDLGRPSGEIASEVVRARAPAWILSTSGPLSPALRERWAGVPAVAQGHLVDLRAPEFVQAGPRTAEGLRRLARILSGTEPGR